MNKEKRSKDCFIDAAKMSITKQKSKKRGKRRTWLMPQEVVVWYVLPAIRRELTRAMIKKKKPQKQIAKMLGVTEPAITQYKLKKSKRSRGDQVNIPDKILVDIDKAADVIIEAYEQNGDKRVYEIMTREVNHLIEILRDAGVICDVHREHCEGVHKDCKACK